MKKEELIDTVEEPAMDEETFNLIMEIYVEGHTLLKKALRLYDMLYGDEEHSSMYKRIERLKDDLIYHLDAIKNTLGSYVR